MEQERDPWGQASSPPPGTQPAHPQGAPGGYSDATVVTQQMQQQSNPHLTVVAALMLAWAGFALIIGLIVLAAAAFGGAVGESQSGVDGVFGMAAGGGLLVFFIMLLAALPALFAGIGILQRREWGRILGIIVAVIALFNIPFGTAFGIYALIILTRPEAQQQMQQTVVHV